MFKRSFSRGTSIVAALVLVGVLSIALVLTQYLRPNNLNTSSQSAQAAATTARPATTGTTAAAAAARCDAAKQAAISNGGTSPSLNQPFTKNTTENNKCIGAVLDETLVNNLIAQKVQNPQIDPRAYKCVGESSKVYMTDKGTGTVISRADASVEEGKCQTQFCDVNGIKCSASKAAAGGMSIQAWAADPSTVATLPPDILKGVASLGNVDPQTQAALSGAFNDQIDQQIKSQNQNVDTAQQQLDSLAVACGEAPSNDPVCTEKTQAAQQDLQKQQQQLADLQKQKADFASTINNDIKPGDSSTPGWCDGGGKGTTDCAGGPDSKLCPSGQIGTPPNCRAGGPSFPGNSPAAPAPQNPEKPTSGGLGNIGQTLQSLLGGLMKGIKGAGAPAAGPACPSDPTAYAQQQQQYQQQMQQYQYQLQQYQYQQQQLQYQAQVTGYAAMAQPIPPVAPVACTPTSSSNTCAAAPAQPSTACPAGTTLRPVTAQQSNGASCTTGWQCAASGATTPTAQISCQPQVADVGMSVSISFGCTNATGSRSGGFDSLGATSGSTSTIITPPPAGVNAATYGITCINQNLSGQASCSVQVSRPSIVLVANPKVVATSTASTVGWVTSGMSSCVVSSPQQSDFTATNASNTSVNGMASTSPITRDTDILLHCITLGGGTRDATTTISSTAAGAGGQTGTLSVSSSADGASIARGDTNTIRWSSTNVPSGSKMSLWLFDVNLNQVTALIKNELSASSTYRWTLPAAGSACDASSNLVCGADLVPGRQYGVEADLYTGDPANASFGTRAYTGDVFTISQ